MEKTSLEGIIFERYLPAGLDFSSLNDTPEEKQKGTKMDFFKS